jgi:hypothetical protein
MTGWKRKQMVTIVPHGSFNVWISCILQVILSLVGHDYYNV